MPANADAAAGASDSPSLSPAPLPPGLADPRREPDVVAVREWLAAERERAVDEARTAPRSGLLAAAAFTVSVDALLAALAARKLSAWPGLVLAALGDWGRRELAPYGELRGVLLAPPETPLEAAEAVAGLTEFLRDAGLDCRLDCISGAAAAGRIAAGRDLLEWGALRVVRGDEAAAEPVSRALDAGGARAAAAVAEEILRRHAEAGGIVCRSQPDLSSNPGGLLDWSALGFFAARRPADREPDAAASEDTEEAARAAGFLSGCRIVAHGLAGERADRLTHEAQSRLAAALGYRPAEDFGAAVLLMRDVFAAMRSVHRALRTELAPFEERGDWGSGRRTVVERRRPVGTDFTRIGNRLYLSRPDLFEGRDAALMMMRGFRAAAAGRLSSSRELLRRVHDNLYAVDAASRESPEMSSLFREILRTRGTAAETLRSMHESGFLGAWLPEFAEIELLVTTDVYHDFTVDEHSLMAVAALDAAERGAAGVPELAAKLAAGSPDMFPVKLSALLHDVGQSKGSAGHEERAAVMLPRIARQLMLDEAEARTVIFLIENHRLLADAAGGRMTTDERLLADLAERVGESSRLDALYLVTVADLAAVGSGSLPAWRAEQLAALHARLSAKLSARPARGRGRLAEELSRMLPAGVSAADAAAHLDRVPERYLLEVSPEEAALHLRLIGEMDSSGAAVDFHRRQGHVHFWVIGRDRPRRFSQLAGAFLAAGASIFSARAYTRADGIIIDQFEVADAIGPDSGGSDEFWAAAAGVVRDVLAGRRDVAELVAGARKSRSGSAAPERRDVPPRVAFDNLVSAEYTVVDVTCADRLGLLYALCGALSDAGADIAFAKISTIGGVATDVFYVTADGVKATGREDLARIRSAVLAACRDM